jgi:hypothetical protein
MGRQTIKTLPLRMQLGFAACHPAFCQIHDQARRVSSSSIEAALLAKFDRCVILTGEEFIEATM